MSVRKLGLPSAEYATGCVSGVTAEEVERRRQADRQLRFLARDILPLVDFVLNGFSPDPGTSDLDDEQPIHIMIPFGEYRRCQRLKPQLEASL